MLQKISKSELKPKLLQYLRKVEKTHQPLLITDRGQVTAKIIPFQENKNARILKELKNSVIFYEDPLEPVGVEDWKLL